MDDLVYKQKLDDFRELVRKHDLFYSFSDDHRYWVAGEASWKAINEASKEILPDDAADIWNAHMIETFGSKEEAEGYLTTAERWLNVRSNDA